MTRKRGRPYQPLPKRSNRGYVLVIVLVGVVLVVGFGILTAVR
jgi:Tfp pilus assembly protein PilX